MVASDRKPSLEEIAFRIASAYLRQRYPLSEEGLELWHKVKALVASGRVPIKYIDILPTVENPRPELFVDFNLTPEQELAVFGWRLSCVQSHRGCAHQCEQCYKGASCQFEMMPFAGAVKIAEKKWKYDKQGYHEWKAWEAYLQDRNVADFKIFNVDSFIRTAPEGWLKAGADIFLTEWGKFSPKWLRLRVPFNGSIPSADMRREYIHCVPINLSAILTQIAPYDDNDPLEYRDCLFLHQDGSPADFGDFFALMSSIFRQITITTAGWFSGDKIACRAMAKIIDLCVKDPLINGGQHRISVSMGERHCKKDPGRYIDEIIRMIQESAPIKPLVNVYYDRGADTKTQYLMFKLGDYFADKQKDIGIEDNVLVTPISFMRGRAIALRHGEDCQNYDPDAGLDGIIIRPNGEVVGKPDFVWDSRVHKDGTRTYFPSVPYMSDPEPTGIWLYKLKGGGN